jgi:multimeric flavodoxin WrbA
MNILILNGSPDRSYGDFDRYIHFYQLKLHHLGHYVKKFVLRDMELSLDPENTLFTGDINYVFNSLKDADLIVFASPLINGRLSGLSIAVQRSITAYYQKLFKSHSREKFTSIFTMPLFGAVVMPDQGISEHEILLNKLTQERIATNLSTMMSFFITTKENFTEAIFETLEIIKCRDAYADVAVEGLN